MTQRLDPPLAPRRLAKCLPWLLLVFSLSSLLVFSGERDSFYRPYMSHNWKTAKDLAVTANLSLQHHLRLFVRLQPDQDGEPSYEVYSRFPVTAYALVKLATLPFDDDLARQLLAARMLALALFFGAAALAFLALCRIARDAWIALAATLLAFSSFHMLYWSDAAGTEIMTDLFGMMLVLHGMVVYTQDGRFGQLLAKSCVALLLGWHVYALLAPFVALGLVEEAAEAWSRHTRRSKSPSASQAMRDRLHTVMLALRRSRLLILATATLLFGSALLAFNFANEHAALEGEVPLADLPSVRSILYRTGLESEFLAGIQPRRFRTRSGHDQPWSGFLYQQIHAVGVGTFPYVLPMPRDTKGRVREGGGTGILVAGVGILALGGCLLAPLLGRMSRHSRLPLWALALSGLTWALPMRHNVYDHFLEYLFYVGVPLAAYALIFMHARQRFGNRVAPALAVVAALAFFLSGHKISRLTADSEIVDRAQALNTDFQNIRGKTKGKTVFVTGDGAPTNMLASGPFATAYYLNGSILQYDSSGHWPEYRLSRAHRNRAYDFILSGERFDQPSLLTPNNRLVFLYDGRAFGRVHDFYLPDYRAEYETIVADEPAAAGDVMAGEFDVYLQKRQLFYVKEPCVEEDAQGILFLHIVAKHLDKLPPNRQEFGFDNLDFRFEDNGVLFDGKCMANTRLPDYEISAIGTGGVAPDGRQAWRVDLEVDAQM